MQLLWQGVHFDSSGDAYGEVALGTTSGISDRIGLRGRWTITPGNGQIWQPYVRADFWQDWGGNAPVTYGGTDVAPLQEQSRRLKFGGGFTAKIDNNFSVFADGDYQFAVGGGIEGERRDAAKGLAGVRYTW